MFLDKVDLGLARSANISAHSLIDCLIPCLLTCGVRSAASHKQPSPNQRAANLSGAL